MGWSNLCLVLLFYGVTIAYCKTTTVKPMTEIKPEIKPRECALGQSHWCKNLTNAVQCGALKHCIQGVWEKEIPYEIDDSEVCKICLDMVKQARDQLRSNETQADLKTVLDASCTIIPIKVVREDCIKMMDDFAVQIVDILSSQMNPSVVCSVAGLCYNPKIHELEKEYHNQNPVENKGNKLTCSSCYNVVEDIKDKVDSFSTDKMLSVLSELCSHTGSYSDGCMAWMRENVNSIHETLKEKLEPKPVCSVAGLCKELYHNHDKTLVRQSLSASSVKVITVKSKSDLPCDLCTQLVVHLKDILISNSTEEEFKLVLTGICKQMKVYKDQCLNIVEEYYDVLYNFLVSELDGKGLCTEIGICPGTKQLLRPLLPVESEQTLIESPELAQLPVERLNPLVIIPSSFLTSSNQPQDKGLCAMCEYLLHFVQQEITLPSNEKKIRDTVMKACDRLPATIAGECDSFVQTYMNTFIALLANRIDPSQVCPSLRICPGVLIAVEHKDKPTCPLCLLAMEEINRKVKNNTVNEINDVLDDLCLRDQFPNSLSIECVNFVVDNRRAIVDMVVTEFTAQESCVYIESCVAPDLKPEFVNHAHHTKHIGGDIETNEISHRRKDVDDSNTCALCEFVLTKIDQELEDKKTHEEIKDIVYKVCKVMPKTLTVKCRNFISQYADLVIELLAQEIDPKEICTLLNLCGKASTLIQSPMQKCLLCELLMDGLRTVLTNEDVDVEINRALERACNELPRNVHQMCLSMVIQLAPQIENALETLPVGNLVCRRIGVCEGPKPFPRQRDFDQLGGPNCLLGPNYWCRATTTAAACQKIEYCQQKIWKASKPRKSHNKGRITIRY